MRSTRAWRATSRARSRQAPWSSRRTRARIAAASAWRSTRPAGSSSSPSSAANTCSAQSTSGASSQRSTFTVTSRSASSMRRVSSRTAAASSGPAPARSSHGTGSPTTASASERKRSLRRNTSPTGTTGKAPPVRAAAPSAMRAAPVLSGTSDGSLWLVPSGKIPTASPPASASKRGAEGVLVGAHLRRVVLGPVHRDRAGAAHQPPHRRVAEERRLRQEAHRPPGRGDHRGGVQQRVGVVGDQQRGAARRHPPARHLEAVEGAQRQRGDPREEGEEPHGGAGEGARSVTCAVYSCAAGADPAPFKASRGPRAARDGRRRCRGSASRSGPSAPRRGWATRTRRPSAGATCARATRCRCAASAWTRPTATSWTWTSARRRASRGRRPTPPTVVILHGLEGCSQSGYVLQTMRELAARGIRAAAMNFRTCGGEPNRLARFYHSGETGDLGFVLRLLGERWPDAPLGAVGSRWAATCCSSTWARRRGGAPARRGRRLGPLRPGGRRRQHGARGWAASTPRASCAPCAQSTGRSAR